MIFFFLFLFSFSTNFHRTNETRKMGWENIEDGVSFFLFSSQGTNLTLKGTK